MKRYLLLLSLFLVIHVSLAQETASEDGRIRPIKVDLPIEFPRDSIKAELDELVQPVLPVGEVTVQNDVIKTRFDRHESLKLTIPEAAQDDMKKDWSKYLKKNADGKMKTDGNKVNVQEVELPGISGGAFDAELQFESNPEATFIWLAMERDSAMITSSSPSFSEAGEELRSRGVAIYQGIVQKEVETEEKVLRKMNSEYDVLVRDSDKMHKKIDDMNARIVNDNNELDINTQNIADAEDYVDKRRDIVDNASEDQLKDAEKELKKAEKDLQSYIKQEQKLKQNLERYVKTIRENKEGIITNLSMQKDKLMSIKKQELLLDAYKEKLAQIE